MEEIKIEGFNIELQSLPSIAAKFALFDSTQDFFSQNTECVEIINKSRKYLNLLLDKALERLVEKTED